MKIQVGLKTKPREIEVYAKVKLEGLSLNGTLPKKEPRKQIEQAGYCSQLKDEIKILHTLFIFLREMLTLGFPTFSSRRNT
jgi:hypothetical protein